jgi:hypothetical protein
MTSLSPFFGTRSGEQCCHWYEWRVLRRWCRRKHNQWRDQGSAEQADENELEGSVECEGNAEEPDCLIAGGRSGQGSFLWVNGKVGNQEVSPTG